MQINLYTLWQKAVVERLRGTMTKRAFSGVVTHLALESVCMGVGQSRRSENDYSHWFIWE